jgi:hypothetical protein
MTPEEAAEIAEAERVYSKLQNEKVVLTQPRLKANRANEHIKALEDATLNPPKFLYNLDFEYVHGTGPHGSMTGRNYAFWPKQQIPEFFAILIGDAVHNLRSVLDYLFVGMLRDKVPAVDSTKFQFPFGKVDGQGLEQVLDGKRFKPIRDALPDFKRFILEDIKPYVGGNDTLVSLNILSNMDKHNLIVPTTGIPKIEVRGILLTTSPFRRVRAQLGGGNADKPQIIFLEGHHSVYDDAKITFEIRFSQIPLLGLKPVVPAMLDIAHVVTETIESFESFLAPNP